MSRYSSQTTYTLSGVEVPLPGVSIYVYGSDTGQLATLTADGGAALANPLTSDGFGNFYFNAPQGLYDLRYVSGGKTVYQEDGVPVGGYSAAYRAIALDVVNTTPLVVTSASGQSVSSRGLLAGISAPANGQIAVLTEAGRQGRFKFSTANLSTFVTADPYQGLYVPPSSATTGASGAWVRDVADNIYHTEWWGMQAAGNNGHLAFASMLALIPSGATIMLDPGDTTFGSTVRTPASKSFILDGYGPVSRIKWNLGAAATHVIIWASSASKIRNIRISGSPTGYGAGNPSCIIVTGKDTNLAALTPVDDVEIYGCVFDSCSLPLCFFGDSLNGSGGAGTVQPATRVRAHHNIIKTNVQGVSLFGCDDCEVHDNVIEFDPSIISPAGTPHTTLFRILGSRRYKVHNNMCLGAGETTANGGNNGITLDAASFGAGQPRRQNQDGEIVNNVIRDVGTPIVINESTGTVLFQGNKFIGDTTSTRQSMAIQIVCGDVTDSVVSKLEKLHLLGNLFRGYASWMSITPYNGTGVPVKHIVAQGNTWLGNMNTTAFPGTFVVSAQVGGVQQMDCTQNRFMAREGGMTNGNISFQNTLAGENVIWMDNIMPERATGNRANGIGGYGGSGTFVMGRGGETLASTYGSNIIYATGTFAASS